MKTFVCVLSAAVAAGLLTYFGFDAMNAFGLMSNRVHVNISVFIGFIAVLALLAALLAVTFRGAVARADDRLLARLEARVAQLESDADAAALRPTPPAQGSPAAVPPPPPA